MSNTLYDDLKAAGCELDHHESDLYVKDSPEARAILAQHNRTGQRFTCAIDHAVWLDVPFAYEPFWAAKAR